MEKNSTNNSSPKRLGRFVSLAIFAGVFLYAFFSVLRPIHAPIDDETWQQAEALISNHAKNPRAMVIVHPAWEDSALAHFKTHFLILGKPNIDSYKYYPRIWVVLTHGADVPSYLEGFQLAFDESPTDDVRVLRFDKPDAETILYDFFPSIEDAEVSIFNTRQSHKCERFHVMRWHCPLQDWNQVGQRPIKVNDVWESCIWMHPINNFTTKARFPDVPIGKRLVGEFALSDEAAELRNGAAVEFTIRIGKEIEQTFETVQKPGWNVFEIDTNRLDGQKAIVTFEVKTRHSGLRHFCFRAQTRSDALGQARSMMPHNAREAKSAKKLQKTPNHPPRKHLKRNAP